MVVVVVMVNRKRVRLIDLYTHGHYMFLQKKSNAKVETKRNRNRVYKGQTNRVVKLVSNKTT